MSKTLFLATTPSAYRARLLCLTIAAPTWFDARAYAVRHFASLGEYVDAMSLKCERETRPLPAQVECEWRGSDYAGQRRIWARTRDAWGHWRKWGLA